VTPDTVAFAVRSLVRLGSAAREAYEQSIRDAAIKLHDLPVPDVSEDEALWGFFDVGDRRSRVEDGGDLQNLWIEKNGEMVPRDNAARQILITEQLKILEQMPVDYRQSWIAQRFRQQAASGLLVQQWKEGKGPPTPAARLVLAFADVALDYVGANPGILGVGGNGEKLITALSANFRALLPDVDDPEGWKGREATHFYVERALAITLHTGLKTVSESPDLLVAEEHYRDLLQQVLQPFVRAFDERPDDRPQLIDLRDTLLGPVAEAALSALQKHQEAFLGHEFNPASAVGAITSAFLTEASSGPITEVFTKEGAVRLYRSVLELAVHQPSLFVDKDGPKADLVRDLLARVGKAALDNPKPFDRNIATNLSIIALETLGQNAPSLLDIKDDAWKMVAGDMLTSVLEGLKAGLASGASKPIPFERMFSSDQAVRLLSIFMEQAAKTPGMLVGKAANDEIKGLIATIVTAATGRGANLLTPTDWIGLAKTIADEAARNPWRLIQAGKDPEQQLATRILRVMLSAAAEAIPNVQRNQGSLLFGETLREAVVIAIRTAAGNAEKADANVEAIGQLVQLLNAATASKPLRLGAREWLGLFERNAAATIAAGLPTGLTVDSLLAQLEQRNA